VSVTVNGVDAGSARSRLNNNGQFIELDELELEAGELEIELTYRRGGFPRPGTGAYPFGLGPVVLSKVGSENTVVRVSPTDFLQLCGQRLDWVAAVR
jgi:hypothetical protein